MKRLAPAVARPTASTRGPVLDLESCLAPEWWRSLFGPTYLLTDADVLDEAVTRQEVDRFVELLGLPTDARILDLCCGQGRHTLELARRGFTGVEGLDQSAYLLDQARAAAAAAGLDVAFREGDCRALPYEDAAFDAVLLAGNSFGFFDASHDDAVALREARRVLTPGGVLLIDVADGEHLRRHFAPRSWEWVDAEHVVVRERALSEDRDRLISREVVCHVARGVIADQFYAERLYGRAELEALLAASGFAATAPGGLLRPAVQRGHDAGMMGRRLVLTAVAHEPSLTMVPRAHGPSLRVAVVLGDPRQADPVKHGGVFDEDDFYTIDAMKSAFAALSGVHVRYLDDHATLVDDLRRLRDEVDVVVNLCDEGFDNDARQELHVPALLELAGLPYTGAGPQCLAVCYDKSLVRGAAREMGIPVPEAVFLHPGEPLPDLSGLPFPVIVKPNSGDSSVGITRHSVAHDAAELLQAIAGVQAAVGPDRPLLVEEFLTGQDLTIGIIGNAATGYRVLPITEEDYSALPEGLPHLCGYEAKWLPDSPYMQQIQSVPARLPQETALAVEAYSIRLFERLGCRDYARFDWRLGADGRPRLLEANPNPGWCWDGHLAKQAALVGIDYAGMLDLILRAAAQRCLPVEPSLRRAV